MLESGLFFTLGFLVAALLALLIAPAIWRRAVALTRQRIESSVPLALNEIQADKDQLRAGFAMNTRRLEVNLDTLKTRYAEQSIVINRKRDETAALEADLTEKASRIAELEAQSAQLSTNLAAREGDLAKTTTDLATVEMRLEEKSLSLEEMNEKYQDMVDDFDGQKIEIVARETRLDSISDESRRAREALKQSTAEREEMRAQIKELRSNLSKQTKRAEGLDGKVTALQSNIADAESRLERRETDLKKLREQVNSSDTATQKLQKGLDEAQSQKGALETEISKTAQLMEALLNNASATSDPSDELSSEKEKMILRRQLKAAESARDAAFADLEQAQSSPSDDWEDERRENAVLREHISDLAAEVTAMTAALEGPESPINKALSKGRKNASPASKGKGAKKSDDSAPTLADRILALQAAAQKAP